MNNYTTNCYEMKREIVNLAKKMSKGMNKSDSKFIMDIIYGLAKNKSVLITDIARALMEDSKLAYTVDRLCDKLANFDEDKKLYQNYVSEIQNKFADEPIAIFDDSDIAKRYGKKFEDLDCVRDASSINEEIVNGYYVCESVILTKDEKQVVSAYSKIYSCKSKGFKSMNRYTLESIEAVRAIVNKPCNMVFDRGYDNQELFDYIDNNKDYFVIRINDKRTMLFKGKKKQCYAEAKKRKGKVKIELWFEGEKKEVYISHTKVTLPSNNKDYELVIVYGLSEERPLLLLTNRNIKTKEDYIKVVRLYFYRWRVEEYFRAKKQEYKFGNMRVRTLKSMNNFNLILSILMSYLSLLAEKINKKLLVIKIIERSKSLRKKLVIWITQIARGISEILSFAHTGIREWQEIKTREKSKQLSLF